MKLTFEPFLKHLTKKPLSSFYWLSGDEPLQLQESHQALLNTAAQYGFVEKERFDAQSLDASLLRAAYYSTSLFATKHIIEIHLLQGKLVESLAEVIQNFCQKSNPDVLLVLISPKLESSTTQTKAFKTFESSAIVLQCWPVSMEQFPEWLSARLARYHLKASLAGLKCLADLVEGNLLYAMQSIEKLAMIYAKVETPLSPEQILEAVVPQAYFDVFQLNEAFLVGNKVRALRICRNLQESGVEVILVWGALLKDIRLLIKLALVSQQSFSESCQKLGIWEKRKPLYHQALQRGCKNSHMLKVMAQIDQCIKNRNLGNPWLALERFVIRYG